MALKTDYKDAMFDGNRKYRITENDDGTVTIEDVTSYTQTGDKFGANDINNVNAAVNCLNHVTPITLTSTGWTGNTAPYVQTVLVPGVSSEQDAILVKTLEDGASTTVQKAYEKAFGIIAGGTGEIGNGNVTFKVYKKPETDIIVGLRGV